MRISLEDGTIYYEKGVVIKRGMSPNEVLEQLGRIYTNPEKSCICGCAWFPALPNADKGVAMRVDICNSPIQNVYFIVPRIPGKPHSKEDQITQFKNIFGVDVIEALESHESHRDFSWGTMRLSWYGREVELRLSICYR